MKSLVTKNIWQVPGQFAKIYSHAFEVASPRRMLFISGQVGVKPDGSLENDFARQAEQAIDNVEMLLAEAGMGLKNLVKLTYLLTRVTDQPALGEIRRRRWASAEPPAVTVMVVVALARPEYLIEIEAIAAEE